jgi:hypothetical protein
VVARASTYPLAKSAQRRLRTPASRNVFVNCPFDDAYLPLFRALLFASHDCGFVARTALEDDGAKELRLEKIVRLIRESHLSIHDISRVEVTPAAPYPRFNMPFEAGLAYGAARFDKSKSRDLLILESELYRDNRTTSDLKGQDTKIHGNDPDRMVEAVRAFLARKSELSMRGAKSIRGRFSLFNAALPALAMSAGIDPDEITTLPYLADWTVFMAKWVRATP